MSIQVGIVFSAEVNGIKGVEEYFPFETLEQANKAIQDMYDRQALMRRDNLPPYVLVENMNGKMLINVSRVLYAFVRKDE